MSCQDKFARLINKAGNGEPTIPASADHQNGDWLETDVYEGEFYEDLDTGIVYYRSSDGIITVYDPATSGQNIYNSDGIIPEPRVVRFSDISVSPVGTLLIDGTQDGSLVTPDPGDGITGSTDDGVGVRGTAQVSGIGVFGIANTGEASRFVSDSGNAVTAISNTGAAIQAESQTNIGSSIAGRLLVHMFGDGVTIEASAVLHTQSTTQGFLPPRMTAEEAESISSPAEGLMVYATDGTGVTITTKGWWGYDGATWKKLD